MILKRITSEGLSHHSYFIAKGKEAIVIDPRRDIDAYLELAAEHNCRITRVFETHRNEDYVIGSQALSEFTGAKILHGAGLDFEYGTKIGQGDKFKMGNLQFKVLETPGHTPESLTLTVADRDFSKAPVMAFVGDTLFVGDTGRTDLWGKNGEAAAALYDSIFDTLLPLGDQVLLYPAHGGGSVCGGSIASRNESSFGYERQFNEKLQNMSKDSFIKMKEEEVHVQAPYFKRMEEWNRKGNAPVHRVPPRLNPIEAGELAERKSTVVVDLRTPQAFASAHIPGSYNVWLDGVPAYFGWIAPMKKDVVVIMPEHAGVDQVSRLLYRIGYDNVAGYVKGGFDSWQNEGRTCDSFEAITVEKVKKLLDRGKAEIIDVRKEDEWEQGTIEGSHKIFVGDLEKKLKTLDKNKAYISMCAVGHRGGLGASILARNGFSKVYNFLGGYKAWKSAQKHFKKAA